MTRMTPQEFEIWKKKVLDLQDDVLGAINDSGESDPVVILTALGFSAFYIADSVNNVQGSRTVLVEAYSQASGNEPGASSPS